MNRAARREQDQGRQKAADRRFKLPPGELGPIDLAWCGAPSWMSRAFSNNRYVVMIDDRSPTTVGHVARMMVQRHDDKPIPGHWREMQNIKNAIFGKEATGVEYYPAESELVDMHNIYWMWIYPCLLYTSPSPRD